MKNSVRLTGPVAALLVGMAVIAAPFATADATDDVFLQALGQQGITFTNLSNQTVVNAGHGVCQDWASGATLAQTLSDVKGALGLTDNNSGYFIGAATQSYCPQYVSKATQG
ncbi:DUF732 domain-containing protein [Mycobacterium nebraskense]|uniref:DUF732 domain-containing protein n=1 Tax=Mycobacterium nebraskense TaxID=244292 RepID=A0A0F5N9H0_9MYCO|nr:DUF732 domain-containing protein [Mycobacterium nebraskense]KKC02933.1 hypothetical protein WU83_21595 [Mycobacterium nebraskense]KLO39952.1 hypothetical protein ABW17_18510 [Mycobacterium nebraskense]MBI2693905.1 DUF732 domain-containing protein [Mycobacterium nebraskense]MCV7120572.1 DUF732 domain-containing protein [Mycobacterium nebraskense]ORW21939.1 hypothetical protein AWC17_00100 [Mycobacterium nebraskense]